MGEAKRRKQLGISPNVKKNKINKSERYFSWIRIIKSKLQNYPYVGISTMALGVIIFLVSGGANSINN